MQPLSTDTLTRLETPEVISLSPLMLTPPAPSISPPTFPPNTLTSPEVFTLPLTSPETTMSTSPSMFPSSTMPLGITRGSPFTTACFFGFGTSSSSSGSGSEGASVGTSSSSSGTGVASSFSSSEASDTSDSSSAAAGLICTGLISFTLPSSSKSSSVISVKNPIIYSPFSHQFLKLRFYTGSSEPPHSGSQLVGDVLVGAFPFL